MRQVLIAACMLAAMAGLASAAEEFSPEGQWRLTTGEAEFEARLCGDDGTALCATLTSLSGSLRVPEATPYVGTELVKGAMKVAPNTWAGLVSVEGETLSGSVLMTDANTMQVAGCLYLVACESFTVTRQ